MGYESRLIVGYRSHYKGHKGPDFCDRLMTLDISKLSSIAFVGLFDKPVDFELYMDDGNTIYEKDCYGTTCGYTSLSRVIEGLATIVAWDPEARRPKIALKALQAINPKDFEWKDDDGSFGELVVVHYGY